jgi:hypothetical protein
MLTPEAIVGWVTIEALRLLAVEGTAKVPDPRTYVVDVEVTEPPADGVIATHVPEGPASTDVE